MAVYTPIVTFYPQGVVSVVSEDSTPYSTVLQSMGSFNYGVNEIYIKSDSIEQILQNFTFNTYNANGNLESFVDVPTIDPYQYQSSINLSMEGKNVVLNGRTNLDFKILPNEVVNMSLYTTELSNKDYLNPTYFFCNDFFTSQLKITNDFL